MAISMTHSAGAAAAALAAMVALAGAALPAQAQTLIPGVTGCSAEGGKQAGGAVVGALAGGLLGNSLSGHNRTTGTLVGGALGAAAGSAVGCQMQKNEAQSAAENEAASAPADAGDDYPLARGVVPASYDEAGDRLVATRTVSLRASPDRHSHAVGQLRRGERFDDMAQVRGTNWILVGRDGVGVGYVQDTFTRPDGQRYARGN
jgi:hypothetical protein